MFVIFSQMSEANSQSQTSLSRSRSVSQAGGVYEGERGREKCIYKSENRYFCAVSYLGKIFWEYFKINFGDNLSVLDDYPELRQETPSQEEEEEEEEPGDDLEEVEEGEENLAVPTQPKYEPCPEDDDFLAALDKMVNENIAESKNLGRTPV